MIELYHAGPAGHSAAVLIALAEKGLDFASHEVDLAGSCARDEALLGLNPSGQVPVLVADGKVLTESFFILLWLDETYPQPPLGGADPRARYQVQKWGKYVETHIAPNLAVFRWVQLAALPDEGLSGRIGRLPKERRDLWNSALAGFPDERVAAARAALEKAALRVAGDLEQAGWLAGADYSLADIAAYPHLAQFAALEIELPGIVRDWLERIAARGAVRQAAGDLKIVATMGPEAGRWG